MKKVLAGSAMAVLLSACQSFDHAGTCETAVKDDFTKRAIKIALADKLTKAKAKTSKYKMEVLEEFPISHDTLDDLENQLKKMGKDQRFRAQTPRMLKAARIVKKSGGEPGDVYVKYGAYKTVIGEWPWFFYSACASWKGANGEYYKTATIIQKRSKKPR